MSSQPVATVQSRRGRILTRPEDIHCVVFHLVSVAAYAAAFWIWCHPEIAGLDTWYAKATFVASAAFLLGWISGVDVGVNFHNHAHRRVFRSRALSRWFGRFWTFTGGWPAWYWRYAHVTVHHANLLHDRDWTLPNRRADGSFESMYRYVFLHWPWRYVVHLARDFTNGKAGPNTGRRALKELSIFVALWSIPWWIDPWMAVWLWVLPQWIANGVIMGSGMYVQHVDCTAKTERQPLRHSNGFHSQFFNLMMFNIGYHVEHHDHPGVHWADLPEFHREQQAEDRAAMHYVPYGYYGAAHRFARFKPFTECVSEFRNDGVIWHPDERRLAPAPAKAAAVEPADPPSEQSSRTA